jgi:hypothetical protein
MKYLFLSLIFLQVAAPVSAAIVVESDDSWKVSKTASSRWETTQYNDSDWLFTKAPTRGVCDYYADPIFFALPMWSINPIAKEAAFFRKPFHVDVPITKATLKVGFDDDGEAYVNGILVAKDTSGLTEKTPIIIDVTEHIKMGPNILAMRAVDSFGGCQWAQASLDISFEQVFKLDVPLQKQDDPLWEDGRYAGGEKDSLTCGSTIGACGCALTSLSMLLSYYGVPTTPAILNNYFTQNQKCFPEGCVSQGYVYGNVRWNAVNSYSKKQHDLFGGPKIQFVPSPGATKGDVSHGKPVVLKVPDESHWVVGHGFSTKQILIRDPLFERNSLPDEIASPLRRYEKVNSDFSLIEVFVKSPDHALVTDMYGRETGYNFQTRQIVQQIPRSFYQLESFPEEDEKGVWWLMLALPEEGGYTLTLSPPARAVVYVSTRDAEERTLFLDKSGHLYYSPEEIADKSTIKDPLQQKCSL